VYLFFGVPYIYFGKRSSIHRSILPSLSNGSKKLQDEVNEDISQLIVAL